MPGITGSGTTFTLPNFVGDLFAVTPTDTPFLSSIGGLTGGEQATATLFPWQSYDLRDADKTRQRVEGAPAPPAEGRVRFNVSNVVEVHQETVSVSYTKLAATGQFNSTGGNAAQVGVAGSNPVVNELNWQITQSLVQVARDIEKSFVNGRFANPADNTEPRRTRSILEATTTNVSDEGTLVGTGGSTIAANGTVTETAHGLSVGDVVVARNLVGDAVGVLDEDQLYVVAAQTANTFTLQPRAGAPVIEFPAATGVADFYETAVLDEEMVLSLLQDVWDAGGISVSETATLMSGSGLKRALTQIFVTAKDYQEMSRNVGGVNVQTIETDFGVLNIMLNRHMPSGALQVVSLDQCAPVFLPIPDKGFLFVEPLANVGSTEAAQLYGEIGLKYGNEMTHGKILGVRRN